MCLCSKQSSLFSFYALPSGGKSKDAVVHWSRQFWRIHFHCNDRSIQFWPNCRIIVNCPFCVPSYSVQFKSASKCQNDINRFISAVWPDWAIYWTLGNFLKPLAKICLWFRLLVKHSWWISDALYRHRHLVMLNVTFETIRPSIKPIIFG